METRNPKRGINTGSYKPNWRDGAPLWIKSRGINSGGFNESR